MASKLLPIVSAEPSLRAGSFAAAMEEARRASRPPHEAPAAVAAERAPRMPPCHGGTEGRLRPACPFGCLAAQYAEARVFMAFLQENRLLRASELATLVQTEE